MEIIGITENLYTNIILHRVQAGERDIPFHACWGMPQTPSTNFLKFVKRFQRGENHKNRTKKRGKTTSNCFPILLYFLVFF